MIWIKLIFYLVLPEHDYLVFNTNTNINEESLFIFYEIFKK